MKKNLMRRILAGLLFCMVLVSGISAIFAYADGEIEGEETFSTVQVTEDAEIIEEEPVAEAPAAEEQKSEEPVAEVPAAEEQKNEEPAAEAPVAEEKKSEEPAAQTPTAEEQRKEEPATGEQESEEPVAEVPAAEEPAAEKTEEIDEYETPLGIASKEYAYEQDEEGNLVLDENGNPVVTVPEGEEIPVTFQKDEEGNLVLDEHGNPIPSQTVPADEVVSQTLVDQLNPDRRIDIYYSWNNEQPTLGGEVTFIAVLYGYENLEYTIQWQQSTDNAVWHDLAEENDARHSEIITRDNYKDYWRVQVTITDVNV